MSRNDLEALWKKHRHRLRPFLATRVQPSDLDDLEQEIWLTVAKGKFSGGDFTVWMFRVAKNLVVDYYRKRGRKYAAMTKAFQEGDDIADHDRSELADPDDDELRLLELLSRCLERLDSVKLAVVRGWLSEQKYRALGEEMGLNEAQIAKQFDTAKNQLRRCLESQRT